MPGTFPVGLATKILTFGRFSNALGTNVGGSVAFGFDDAMLHTPTGEVVVSGMETVTIGPDVASAAVTVPVTVTPDLVAKWDSAAAYTNQRLKITVAIPGYPGGTAYMDIQSDDPAVMDYDTLQPYTLPGGLTVLRSTVSSVAGLGGVVSAADLKTALGMPVGPGGSLVMLSPNGTQYTISVSNAGVLVVTPVV